MKKSDKGWTVITGSTGAIGAEIAKLQAARGEALILVNRSEAKAIAQRDSLMAEHPGARIELISADLMDTGQISAAAEKIIALPGRADALYNNSGVLTTEKILSAQGYESQFAVNTLAPYQMTRALQDKMARAADQPPAMVVNFSSGAIGGLKSLELESLVNPQVVGGLMSTYAQTKLAVTALAPALAEHLKSQNILIRAVDPGATRSAMTTGGSSGMPTLLAWLAPILFASPAKQAAKLIDSADPAAFGGRSGIYVANRREKKMPAPAADSGNQQALLALLDRLLAG